MQPGDRIAQLVVLPIVRAALQVVDNFEDSARGSRRFRPYRRALTGAAQDGMTETSEPNRASRGCPPRSCARCCRCWRWSARCWRCGWPGAAGSSTATARRERSAAAGARRGRAVRPARGAGRPSTSCGERLASAAGAGGAGRRRPGRRRPAARPTAGPASNTAQVLTAGPRRGLRRTAAGRLRPAGRGRSGARRRQAGGLGRARRRRRAAGAGRAGAGRRARWSASPTCACRWRAATGALDRRQRRRRQLPRPAPGQLQRGRARRHGAGHRRRSAGAPRCPAATCASPRRCRTSPAGRSAWARLACADRAPVLLGLLARRWRCAPRVARCRGAGADDADADAERRPWRRRCSRRAGAGRAAAAGQGRAADRRPPARSLIDRGIFRAYDIRGVVGADPRCRRRRTDRPGDRLADARARA